MTERKTLQWTDALAAAFKESYEVGRDADGDSERNRTAEGNPVSLLASLLNPTIKPPVVAQVRRESQHSRCVNLFRAVMEGNGCMSAVDIAKALGRESRSVRETMQTTLVRFGYVYEMVMVSGHGVKYYEWRTGA